MSVNFCSITCKGACRSLWSLFICPELCRSSATDCHLPVQTQPYLYLCLFRKSHCEQNVSVLLPEINSRSHLIMEKLRPEREGVPQRYRA